MGLKVLAGRMLQWRKLMSRSASLLFPLVIQPSVKEGNIPEDVFPNTKFKRGERLWATVASRSSQLHSASVSGEGFGSGVNVFSPHIYVSSTDLPLRQPALIGQQTSPCSVRTTARLQKLPSKEISDRKSILLFAPREKKVE